MISNQIFTASLRKQISLTDSCLMRLANYRPPKGRFPGGILKLASGTFLLFTSGKVVVNGVKDEPDELEFEMVTGHRLFDVTLSHCSGYMRVGPLCLSALHARINCQWEPELHPGILFKIENVSVIIYSTGTVMYCGCRGLVHATEVEENVLKMINI